MQLTFFMYKKNLPVSCYMLCHLKLLTIALKSHIDQKFQLIQSIILHLLIYLFTKSLRHLLRYTKVLFLMEKRAINIFSSLNYQLLVPHGYKASTFSLFFIKSCAVRSLSFPMNTFW